MTVNMSSRHYDDRIFENSPFCALHGCECRSDRPWDNQCTNVLSASAKHDESECEKALEDFHKCYQDIANAYIPPRNLARQRYRGRGSQRVSKFSSNRYEETNQCRVEFYSPRPEHMTRPHHSKGYTHKERKDNCNVYLSQSIYIQKGSKHSGNHTTHLSRKSMSGEVLPTQSKLKIRSRKCWSSQELAIQQQRSEEPSFTNSHNLYTHQSSNRMFGLVPRKCTSTQAVPTQTQPSVHRKCQSIQALMGRGKEREGESLRLVRNLSVYQVYRWVSCLFQIVKMGKVLAS